MRDFVRRRGIFISLTLQFVSTALVALWVGLLTAGWPGVWYHVFFLIAVGLWFAQLFVVRTLAGASREFVRAVLRLGTHALARHAGVEPKAVRGFVHRARLDRPSKGAPRTLCLSEDVHYSHTAPSDTGPIDTTPPEHLQWFYNVKAYHNREVVVGNVDWNRVPQTGGRAPTVDRRIRSVVSFPIMAQGTNDVIGTLTFDSQASAQEMRWLGGNSPNLAGEAHEIISQIRHAVRCIMLNLEPDDV